MDDYFKNSRKTHGALIKQIDELKERIALLEKANSGILIQEYRMSEMEKRISDIEKTNFEVTTKLKKKFIL